MSYPGNPSLSEEIRQRVLQTFEQTLKLAEDGKVREAQLGCDFILQLDGAFGPAIRLRERLDGAEGPVAVDDLRPGEGGSSPPQPEPAADEAAAEGDEPSALAVELADLLDRREFRTLLHTAKENQEQIRVDPELTRIVEAAESRFEAEPYVRSFLDSASRLKQEGRAEEARTALEKARELDPTHPELWSLSDEGAPAGAAAETGAAAPDTDEAKIERLLAEGQEAFDGGDLQAAIDAWSRIFLIDIDHAEANERIEEARTLKAEHEREVEELFHEALSLRESGAVDEAREGFERVLEMAPSHLGAREYLDEIEAGDEAPEAEPAEPSAAPAAPPAPDEAGAPRATPTDDGEPAKVPAAPRQRPPAPPAKRTFPSNLANARFLIIGGLVLIVALAAAWFLYSRRDGLFPNSAVPTGRPEAPGPIERAQAIHDSGETASAIAILRKVPESDPRHAEAQTLIAQWETLVADAGEESEEPPSEAEMEQRARLVRNGREAARLGEFLRATELFGRASAIAPLEGSDRDLMELSRDEIADLERPLQLFRQGDWEFALPDLWQLHQANPDDSDVRRLMVDSYYNLGVRNLQRRDVDKASEMFADAKGLAVEDPELDRLIRFTDHYASQPVDLRYRIFVKYLTFR